MLTGYPRAWRRGSDYAAPPRNLLDRGQRHVWRRRVVAEARAGNLPGKAILTAEAMLACMGEGGELYPAQATIAAKAGVGVRTVARHLARMETLGLLARQRRLVRMPWPEGGRGAIRVQQTSNAYVLLFPTRPSVPLVCAQLEKRPALRNTGCHVGPVEVERRITNIPAEDRVAALAALETVRVAREAALAAKWWAARR